MQVAIKEYLPGDLAMRGEDHSIRSRSEQTLEKFTWGRNRFLDESRTLASFRHPNIVRVMRFFEANQTAYMVMEFVAGQPLNEWIKTRRPVSTAGITELALALLGGVDVIHQSGFLHRDIKPGNIFMRQDGAPVLLDFGSARAASVDTERTAIVSPGYAPLEQYHANGNQGPWTDIYALGGVLYWLVHSAEARRFPPALLEAIDWALAPSERARPQTVAAWRQSLAALADRSTSQYRPVDADHTLLSDATTVLQPRTGAPDVPPPTGTAAVFDPAVLHAIASDLAVHLGPVANIVVKSAARKCATLQQLVEALAPDIADGAARADFVKKHGRAASERTGSPASERSRPTHTNSLPTGLYPSQPVFDAVLLARTESELAQHIGAVAKAIVRRAAARARTEQELFNLLADEIDNAQDRKAFLRRVMSVSGRV